MRLCRALLEEKWWVSYRTLWYAPLPPQTHQVCHIHTHPDAVLHGRRKGSPLVRPLLGAWGSQHMCLRCPLCASCSLSGWAPCCSARARLVHPCWDSNKRMNLGCLSPLLPASITNSIKGGYLRMQTLLLPTVTDKATYSAQLNLLCSYFCVIPEERTLRICLRQTLIFYVEEIMMTRSPGFLLESHPFQVSPRSESSFPGEPCHLCALSLRDSMLPGCWSSGHSQHHWLLSWEPLWPFGKGKWFPFGCSISSAIRPFPPILGREIHFQPDFARVQLQRREVHGNQAAG